MIIYTISILTCLAAKYWIFSTDDMKLKYAWRYPIIKNEKKIKKNIFEPVGRE